MKKNKKILLFVILIICIVAAAFIFASKSSNNTLTTKKTPEEVKKDVEDIVNTVIDPNVTQKELSKKLGKKVSGLEIMQGNDSYIRETPKNIKDIDLSKYEKMQKEYAKQLEKEIADNLEITYTETEEVFDGRVIQHVEILGYYYRLYVDDLSKISARLLNYAGLDIQTLDESNSSKIALYKAKVKGMEILSNYLSEYQNYEETKQLTMEYTDNGFSEIDITTLVMGINGSLFYKMDFSKKENVEAQQKRIDMYIDTAIQDGSLDVKNPLELK